ncbi:Xylose isomerase [Zea mays]|uniref:xylose isomerase n=1 Tax=Zea mays TaxID=4577 RepID=A0A1D6MLF4_MAIZE|nr:Xylose isomerase [Zea mays]
MLNAKFNDIATNLGLDLYLVHLRASIDKVNELVYDAISNDQELIPVFGALVMHLCTGFGPEALPSHCTSTARRGTMSTCWRAATEGVRYMQQSDIPYYLNHVELYFVANISDCLLDLSRLIFFKLLLTTRRRLDSTVIQSRTLLIEPKPQEPTKHQYDWDVATTFAFLQKYGPTGEFEINVECNHATLSGHRKGWDTDQFMTDIAEATLVMSSVVKNGGLAPGGFNFDAKLSVPFV